MDKLFPAKIIGTRKQNFKRNRNSPQQIFYSCETLPQRRFWFYNTPDIVSFGMGFKQTMKEAHPNKGVYRPLGKTRNV